MPICKSMVAAMDKDLGKGSVVNRAELETTSVSKLIVYIVPDGA